MAGNTIQVTATTAFVTQMGITILVAVSLKAMWNLMHVMQVIAYLRLLVEWPANASMMLKAIHNAATLENLVNAFYDTFRKKFFSEQFNENEE